MGPVGKIKINRKKNPKNQKLHILDSDYIVLQPLVPQYNFDHHAKSRDMTSHRPLVWRDFVLPTFGPKVQAEAKILQALKIA